MNHPEVITSSEANQLGAPLDLSLNAVALSQMLRTSMLIADRAAVADIETEGVPCRMTGGNNRWYDVRPMLDEREHSSEVAEMNRQSIAYAIQRRLVEPHPESPDYVRVLRQR